jgi:cysteine-S-conjugate beta-lyase
MGTIFSVATAIRMCAKEGEGIIVQPPVYYRYEQAARRLGRKTVNNNLKLEHDRYVIDFEDLEKCMANPNNKLLVLCNPQNPIGRVWSMDELERIAHLSKKYSMVVFSDEIFAEIVFDHHRTIPYASIETGQEYAITSTSLGKTFNFTGVNHANILIPNDDLREGYIEQRNCDHYGSLEPLAYAAICGAYTQEGLCWKEKVRAYIEENRNYIHLYFDKYLKPNRVMDTEGTYVAWIEWRGLDFEGDELIEFLRNKALFDIEPGEEYSKNHKNFTRMNMAASHEQIVAAMERLRIAYEEYQKFC